MRRTKATGFEFLRWKMQKLGQEFEKLFLAELDEEEMELYRKALSVSWVDLDVLTRVFKKAAKLMYPQHPRPLIEFGREEAKQAMTGIYKIFLRFATVPFIIQKTALLWRTYYDKGLTEAEADLSGKQAGLIVKEYPELPADNRTIVLGYTLGLLDLTGAKGVRWEEDYSNPDAWRWRFSWE